MLRLVIVLAQGHGCPRCFGRMHIPGNLPVLVYWFHRDFSFGILSEKLGNYSSLSKTVNCSSRGFEMWYRSVHMGTATPQVRGRWVTTIVIDCLQCLAMSNGRGSFTPSVIGMRLQTVPWHAVARNAIIRASGAQNVKVFSRIPQLWHDRGWADTSANRKWSKMVKKTSPSASKRLKFLIKAGSKRSSK